MALAAGNVGAEADQIGRAMSAGQRAAILTTLLPIRWGPASTRVVKAATHRIGQRPCGIDGPVSRILAARRGRGAAARTSPDMLDLLVMARDEENLPLTDPEITDEVATFLLAGHETTSNTLAWTLALLSAHPAARQRLEEELDAVIAKARAGLGEGRGGRRPVLGDRGRPSRMSFAGQHDTYLNVRGGAASKTRSSGAGHRCGHHGQSATSSATASPPTGRSWCRFQFVPADAAGVLFTVDPASGARNRVVVNANWGLGEAVAGGKVTPDVAVVGRVSGSIAGYLVGGKEVMTVPAVPGTRQQDTPAGLRGRPVLSPDEASELARVGLAIEELYGQPVDVEWARADHRLFVQARTVTGSAAAARPGEQWNDSLSSL